MREVARGVACRGDYLVSTTMQPIQAYWINMEPLNAIDTTIYVISRLIETNYLLLLGSATRERNHRNIPTSYQMACVSLEPR